MAETESTTAENARQEPLLDASAASNNCSNLSRAEPSSVEQTMQSKANVTPAPSVDAEATSSKSQPGLSMKAAEAIKEISDKTLAQVNTMPSDGPRVGSFPNQVPPGFMMPDPVRLSFPGLIKTVENPLTKGELLSALSTNLAPRSGSLPSQPFRHNENTFARVKSPLVWMPANGANVTKGVLKVTPLLAPAISSFNSLPPLVRPPTASEPSTIVQQTPTFNAIAKSNPVAVLPQSTTSATNTPSFPVRPLTSSSTKAHRTYMLPDGTMTASGKGLGRGRPGIKRGPRKSKLATEITAESPKVAETIVVSPTQNEKKRKRSNSHERSDPATPSEPSSRASSEEFIPENTLTRSGRQALKPDIFVPSPQSTPAAKKPRLSSPGPSVPKSAALAKIKRKAYRGREHAALCEHCLRGHGPLGNVIVFCDACNKCWHQRCHDPQVSEAVIKDSKAEWFCSDCERIINGPKKGSKKATPKSKPSLSLSLAPTQPLALVGASNLTREQREAQLSALSKEKLVEMLMRATDLAPALPLFEDPNPPTLITPPHPHLIDSYPTPTQEEEDYEYLYDEHAALYPKPGNGVKLPPESEDLAMLLEGPDCKTFSHNLLTPTERGV